MQATVDIKLSLEQVAPIMRNRVPRQRQLRAAELFLSLCRFALFWDMGTGKTTAILLGLAIEAANKTGIQSVILCPKNVIHSAWMADAVFFPHLKVQPVHGIGRTARTNIITTSIADVFVTTYELFRADQALYLDAGVQRLIVDESSKIKNHKAKTSQIIHHFGDRINSVWCLSGEPAPNSLIEYYSQIRAFAPALVGPSFYRWAFTYFMARKKEVRVKGETREVIIGWDVIPDRWATFTQSLKLYSWALASEDVLDLPEQVDITVPVEMTSKQRYAYTGVEDDLILSVGAGDEVADDDERFDVKAQARLMKCRQVANGFAYLDPADGSASKTIVTYGAAKLEATTDLMDELHQQGEQVVVWANFTHDIDALADVCHDKWSYRILDGRTKTTAADIADFQDHGVDVLVCHPQSVGHGVTLTAAAYAIFYDLSYSSELYQQARKRTHRMGQKKKCFYYHMVTQGTVEPTIVKALQEKRSVSTAMLKYLKREV